MLLLLASLSHADEGMWLPEQLPGMSEQLAEMGLEIPAEQLGDTTQEPLSSIVSLGFCSASFLSEEGLIGTNHHCVEGYLQYAGASFEDRDLNVEGYLAADRSGELSAGPTARIYVVESITDVTEAVEKKLRRWTKDGKRYDLVQEAQKALVAECEAAPNRRCEVASYYGGQQYRLISKLEIKDIRLVYAPPQSVGSYGGEIDNWIWPRHAGDFALIRAYVAPDGSSAPYAEDNVPYTPKSYLKVDATGAQDGEFVMVAGYPGATYRYRTARELRFAESTSYPFGVELAHELIAILEEESKAGTEAAQKLNAPIGWIANGLKYRQGNLDNFRTSGVVARKEAQWAELEAWIAADPIDSKLYAPVLEELDELQAASEATYETDVLLGYFRWLASHLSVHHTAYRWSVEQQKPDLKRRAGFQDRDRERTEQRFVQMEQTTWIPADRALSRHMLERLQALPEDKHVPALDAWLEAAGGIDAALETLYAESALLGAEERVALLEMSQAELQALDNPWMQLAVALEDGFMADKREADDLERGAQLRLQPMYMQALLESSTQAVYPDANSTLRVTVGHVKGYSPADAVWYSPNTTVAGMHAKNTGEEPFDAPGFLLQDAQTRASSRWFDAELGDVPVDFTSTLDSTGGNSGSATLNAQGQLVGFLFDGNYEAISADWVFDDALTRSIHVDIRYALWVMESAGAQHVIDELDIAE
jgi:hypothetical protein